MRLSWNHKSNTHIERFVNIQTRAKNVYFRLHTLYTSQTNHSRFEVQSIMPESTVLLKPGAYKDTLACVGGDTRNLCRQSRSVCVTENRRHRGADRLFVGMCVLNVYACVCVRMYACMHAMCRFFYAPHSKYVFVNGSVCIGVTSSETG